MYNRQFVKKILSIMAITIAWLVISWPIAFAQEQSSEHVWIQPESDKDAALWGIRNGIVFSLWPYGIETNKGLFGGGPRGLIRLGIERGGNMYLLNFLAIEPIVNGKIEFSEISPSQIDEKWGKLMWASDEETASPFYPTANTSGIISHPDPEHPKVEELSLYVFMEKFISGAHPYLKLSIRSDHPQEICIQVFNRADSEQMDYCNITATMGNYARLRQLHFKDEVIDAKTLYRNYEGIDFIEKDTYPAAKLLRSKRGDRFAFATTNENLEELGKWPTDSLANVKRNWYYRVPVKLTQYWRKEQVAENAQWRVRVNGRAKYWSGGSRDANNYLAIPGGPAFENFELQEKYLRGQKSFFGITEMSPMEIMETFNKITF